MVPGLGDLARARTARLATALAVVCIFAVGPMTAAHGEPYDSDTPGTMDDRMPGTLPDERRPGAMQHIPPPGSMPLERPPGVIGRDDERLKPAVRAYDSAGDAEADGGDLAPSSRRETGDAGGWR